MGKRILLGDDDATFGVRVLLGLLVVLLLAAGCGLVSDQPKREAKEVEATSEQAGQEVKKVEPPKGELDKKLDDLDKKVDHVQKDVNDLQKKVDELLQMAHALKRQRQKE